MLSGIDLSLELSFHRSMKCRKGFGAMQRILVIDDDAQIRELLRRILVSEGFAVAEASNGHEALEIQNRDPADLIITDIIMPEKGGIETIRELRAQNPDIKIIAMSGGGLIGPEEHLTLPKRMGVSHTFTKPVEKATLINAVKELLG